MNKRLTKDKLVTLLTVASRGIDEIHNEEHNSERYDTGQCPDCQDATDGLRWLTNLYANRYIKPTEGQQ